EARWEKLPLLQPNPAIATSARRIGAHLMGVDSTTWPLAPNPAANQMSHSASCWREWHASQGSPAGILCCVAKRQAVKPREKFPWLLLLALLLSIFVFWILPRRQGSAPVQVEFTRSRS